MEREKVVTRSENSALVEEGDSGLGDTLLPTPCYLIHEGNTGFLKSYFRESESSYSRDESSIPGGSREEIPVPDLLTSLLSSLQEDKRKAENIENYLNANDEGSFMRQLLGRKRNKSPDPRWRDEVEGFVDVTEQFTDTPPITNQKQSQRNPSNLGFLDMVEPVTRPLFVIEDLTRTGTRSAEHSPTVRRRLLQDTHRKSTPNRRYSSAVSAGGNTLKVTDILENSVRTGKRWSSMRELSGDVLRGDEEEGMRKWASALSIQLINEVCWSHDGESFCQPICRQIKNTLSKDWSN